MANNTTTMRIDKSLYNAIKNIANISNKEIQETLKEAIMDFEDKMFFENLKKSIEANPLDEKDLKEREKYENTLIDNLEDDKEDLWHKEFNGDDK